MKKNLPKCFAEVIWINMAIAPYPSASGAPGGVSIVDK